MLSPLNQFYDQLKEPNKGVFLLLRDCILALDKNITPEWKFGMPFFYCKGKMFCYIRVDKKTQQPYIGVMEGFRIVHPLLKQGDRKRVKTILIDPEKDLPKKAIENILNQALVFYYDGTIKVKWQ